MTVTAFSADEPTLRAPQFGSQDKESLLGSLNLFRGEINLPLTLVALPGRNGVEVSVAAQYQSSVAKEVGTWNREYPTSVLGVGWSLNASKIFVGNRGVANSDQSSYFLEIQGNVVPLYRRGQDGAAIAFETVEFLPWKILYFCNPDAPALEYWTIVKQDGSIWRFGGEHATETGINWDNWVGATTASQGRPFAIAWNLSTVTSVQNDVLTLTYEMDQVAIGSASFTRSARLATITDVFGSVVKFLYQQKQDVEIQWPFAPLYPTDGVAFQFYYETKYLDRIQVFSANETLLFSQIFSYELHNLDPSGKADPNFTKRYLISVHQQMPDAEILPGMELAYDLSADAVNPGALIEVRYPLGARVQYTYSALASIQSSSKIEIVTPTQEYTPGIWHGVDFTVVSFYDSVAKKLQIQAYSWGGVWRVWDSGVLNVLINEFEIITGTDFFALLYRDSVNQPHVRLYRHNDYRPLEWEGFDCQVDNTTDALATTIGDDFIAFQTHNAGALTIYQWMASGKRWDRQQVSSLRVSNVALGGGVGLILAALYDASRAQVRLQAVYRNIERQWKSGDYLDINQSIDWTLTQSDSVWSVGASIASATFITAVAADQKTISSSVTVLRWRADFSFDADDTFLLQQLTSDVNPTVYSIVAGSVVGHAESVFRFDPNTWVDDDLIGTPVASTFYQYAYDSDLALAVAATGDDPSYGSQQFFALRFDPYHRRWTDSGTPYASTRTSSGVQKPVISGNTAVLGRDIFFQNSDSTWSNIGSLPSNVTGGSVQISGLAGYLIFQTDGSSDTLVKFIANGRVDEQFMTLTGESCVDFSGNPGTALAGPTSFVTYRGDSLASARQIFLYKVSDGALPDYLTATPVTSATLDDGYRTSQLWLKYDQQTASFDATGQVAQYQTVRVVAADEQGAYGTTVHTYFNGMAPSSPGAIYPNDSAFTNARDYYGVLAGQIYRSDTFCANGRGESSVINSLWVEDQLPDGQALAGIAVALRQSEKISYLALFSLPQTDAAALDRQTFSSAIAAEFAAQGFSFATPPTVTVLTQGQLWRLEDAAANTWYIENAGVDLAVFGAVSICSEFTQNAKGQIQTTTLVNYNSTGRQERLVTQYTYGWEVYPAMEAANLLTPVVQTSSINESAQLVTAIQTETWASTWPSAGSATVWGSQARYQWTGTAGTETFDFDAANASGWICTQTIIDRNARGSILESRDVSAIPTSTVFDATGVVPVVQFQAASTLQNEASYTGFMPYEAPGPWQTFSNTQDPAALIVSGDAFTGTDALVLPGDADAVQGLRATFAPGDGTARYRISCYFKTEGEPDADGEALRAGISIVAQSSGTEATQFFAFPLTQSQWTYFHCTFDAALCGFASIDQFTVTVGNQQTGLKVWVDNIFLTPFNGVGAASIYDQNTWAVQARCGSLGDAFWTIYDRLQNPITTIGSDATPEQLSARGVWRTQSTSFDPATPNFSLNAVVRSGGIYANFWHGDEYLNLWSVSGDWRIEEGQLHYTGAQTGTVTAKSAVAAGSLALRCTFHPNDSSSPVFGLAFVGILSVQWNAVAWELLDGAGQVLVSVNAAAPVAATDCLLIVSARGVQFFVDGWLTITYLLDTTVSGVAQAFASKAMSLTDLLVAIDPLPQMQYQTNAGQDLQSQALDGDGIIVWQTCCDPASRPAVATKPVAMSDTLFGFREQFVTSIDWISGVMTGEVASAYPQDAGYPYTRCLLSSSPAALVLEQGLPGAVLAINAEKSAEQSKTSRALYQSNVASGLGGDLPAGKYFLNTEINQDGLSASRVTDMLGRVLWSALGSDPDTAQLSRATCDAYGNPTLIQQPNYFDPTLANAAQFVIRQEFDFLKRLISRTDPDTDAPQAFVYDQANRLRFRQDAAGNAQGYLIYCTYDFLGRLQEQGISRTVWDRALLEQHANDPSWVPGTPEWSKRFSYDGDGDDVNTIGRVWQCDTRNGADDNIVTEVFSYDRRGRVIKRQQIIQQVDAPNGQSASFSYDQTGNLTTIDDTNEAASTTVLYGFNFRGQVASVSLQESGQSAQVLATYTYDASGAVATEVFAPESASALPRQFSYNPPGWLTSISDRFFSQTLNYFEGGYGATGNYSGRVSCMSSVFSQAPDSAGFIASSSFALAYDAQSRLSVAAATVTPPGSVNGSFGVTDPMTYDANGNLLHFSLGDTLQSYQYKTGTNQLDQTSANPGKSYQYDPNGQLAVSEPRAIRDIVYEPALASILAIDMASGATTQFRYGANQIRVSMAAAQGTRTLMLSGSGRPLWQNTLPASGTPSKLRLIYGPTGLIAASSSGAVIYAIKDSLTSVRGFYDGQDLCAAYNYLPFGDFLGTAFESGSLPGACRARFVNQAFDPASGLYFFPARLYDPFLGRFYSIDPAAQYPSPYLYVDGNTFNMLDPTGRMSLAAGLEIGLGVLVAVAGVALIGTGLGIGAGAALEGMATGLLIGAGTSSAIYGATHQKGKFNGADFGTQVGLGGLFGVVGGLEGAALNTAIETAFSQGAKVAVEEEIDFGAGIVLEDAVAQRRNATVAEGVGVVFLGGVDGVTGTVITNKVNGDPVAKGMGSACAVGAITGLAGFGASKLFLTAARSMSAEQIFPTSLVTPTLEQRNQIADLLSVKVGISLAAVSAFVPMNF